MSETNGNGHATPVTNNPNACRITGLSTRQSIASILRQALALKDLSFDAALGMREVFVSDEEAERARIQAQAITSLIKGWAESVTISRIVRGIPSPGVIKRGVEQPKSKKARPANKPPSLKPVTCGVQPTAGSVPSAAPDPATPQEQARH